jgi:hypothetical protein
MAAVQWIVVPASPESDPPVSERPDSIPPESAPPESALPESGPLEPGPPESSEASLGRDEPSLDGVVVPPPSFPMGPPSKTSLLPAPPHPETTRAAKNMAPGTTELPAGLRDWMRLILRMCLEAEESGQKAATSVR